MAVVFLDTNLLLRHLTQDHPEYSPKATAYLSRIERREVEARISEIVIFETVFTLHRGYHKARTEIRDAFLPLIELPGIILPGKRRFRRVFDLYVEQNLPFADAYHVVLMEQLGISEIASFDTDFDRVSGIRRVRL